MAEKTLGQGGHYIFSVKGNQPKLLSELLDLKELLDRLSLSELEAEGSLHTETSSGHGRGETRVTLAMPAPDYLEELASWPGAATVVFSKRTRAVGETTTTSSFIFITSLPPNAELIAHATRMHWQVETLHWWLDVRYAEDLSTVTKGHGPENLSLVRKIAHNLLKSDDSKKSIRGRKIMAAGSWDYLMKLCSLLAPAVFPPKKAKATEC